MLTDIFADRYSNTNIWDEFREAQRRLIVQIFRLLSEQICPYWVNGKESESGKMFWTDIHSRLSMELGLKSLSALAYAYSTNLGGKTHTASGTWPLITVCENWMLKEFDHSVSADRFIKERISLVEIGFCKREEEIDADNAKLPERILTAKRPRPRRSGIRIPGDPVKGVMARNASINKAFQEAVNELNTRFNQAGCALHYHNGFIQLATDQLTLQQVEEPFWALVADSKWTNVDIDMKEALDLRDSDSGDPAFYAARALESTLKIVSDEKGLTHGGERGAHNYIDNLSSRHANFLENWESEALKAFFTKIRNPFGHGAGNAPIPSLTKQQTDWAIETCMIWIKSIIRRL